MTKFSQKDSSAGGRCSALDEHSKRCHRRDTKLVDYFGENELYGYGTGNKTPQWVRIPLCSKHREDKDERTIKKA